MNRYKTKRFGNKKFEVSYNLYGDTKVSPVWAKDEGDAIQKMDKRLRTMKINGATDFNIKEEVK